MTTKTPEYTKRATTNYLKKFDTCAVRLPKGTKQEIAELTGMSENAYIRDLVLADLEKRKKKANKKASSTQDTTETDELDVFH